MNSWASEVCEQYVCSRCGEAQVFGSVQSLPGKHTALQDTL